MTVINASGAVTDPAQTAPILLAGEQLSKRYGGVVALDDVSIHVRAGEILGLVGPNGAGKTTLVDLITGAQTSDSGTLTLLGKPIVGTPARRARLGLARTFQHPLLPPDLSVIEALVGGVAADRMTSKWGIITAMVRGAFTGPDGAYERAAQLAAEFNIPDVDRLCGELSLGEQRLVEVIRALAQNPQVMLLDEPFAGADPTGIAGIIDAIREVQRRGHGVILVDHNVDLIAGLTDRVMLLNQGTVAFDGDPVACLSSKQMKDVYFGVGEGGDSDE